MLRTLTLDLTLLTLLGHFVCLPFAEWLGKSKTHFILLFAAELEQGPPKHDLGLGDLLRFTFEGDGLREVQSAKSAVHGFKGDR